MTGSAKLPAVQQAIQLTGPGKLSLNTTKPVIRPGPHQVLARVECVGLCFSDLKLLKQFSEHPRKTAVTLGLPADVLAAIPSYVPGEKPAVPGHEAVVRIVAVGERTRHHAVGERCLVQADYRSVLTAHSNAALGYNFEGALQEYVLMDERVIVDPANGERFLIPVPEHLGSSAVALIEPWACVEDSYVTRERRAIKAGGRLAVVMDSGRRPEGIEVCLAREGKPSHIAVVCDGKDDGLASLLKLSTERRGSVADLPKESFDDIVYFGCERTTIELLNDRLANGGIINIVTGGRAINAPVSAGVGRIHYGATRWVGTTSHNAADAYDAIPPDGEIRAGDTISVIGAGGPMGQMHVIRDLCAGRPDVSVTAVDFDGARLAALMDKARPMADARSTALRAVNLKNEQLQGPFTYQVIMAPLGALVADAIRQSAPGGMINIFAGIPADVRQEIDLDLYIQNRCYMFGTSGSTLEDMRIVLSKVVAGQLDTDSSVDAVCGMAGALDGLAAVEQRTLAGKIVVYPNLHELGLIPLRELNREFPGVAARLDHGRWTAEAERELLRVAR